MYKKDYNTMAKLIPVLQTWWNMGKYDTAIHHINKKKNKQIKNLFFILKSTQQNFIFFMLE
jgi:hypothetical protein